MDCSPPGSSVHGILQARLLEWVAIYSSRGSSPPRDQTSISCIGRWILHCWAPREAYIKELAVLKAIHPTYTLIQGLANCTPQTKARSLLVCINKMLLDHTQACSFVCCWWWVPHHCSTVKDLEHRPHALQSLKDILTGSLHKKFASLCFNALISKLSILYF